MAIRVALRHVTRYRYDRSITLLPQVIRLRPAPHCRTPILAYSLSVEPRGHFLNWQQDPFGNFLARLVFPNPVESFTVEIGLVVDLVTINPFDFFLESGKEHFPFQYDEAERADLAPYLVVQETGSRFDELCQSLLRKRAQGKVRVIDFLVAINQTLQSSLHYDIRMEPGVFGPEDTLRGGHGSCRDFAWLLVNVLRRLGIAARFASGYSIQLVADQKSLEGPQGVQVDCADLHAWAEAYLPGAGWVGLDATSGLFCGEGHIPLACTADPSAAAPVSGSFEFEPQGEGDEVRCEFSFEITVARVEDRPRPTRSYTEAQWEQVVACGARIDELLEAHDVRLTMGGEPTFVSIDDMDGAEWNTEALGPTKSNLADRLIRRLRGTFAPGGVIVHGQGKWYPGEPLPRFAYSLYFRRDGVPIWGDVSRFACEGESGATTELARTFANALVARLELPEDSPIPAHEDVYFYLWREQRLPSNVDPLESRLDDPLERARLARLFDTGLEATVGYVIPLRVVHSRGQAFRWDSGRWSLRRERLYLVPGDSPMGYRLPLDSLPWEPEDERQTAIELDPFANPAPFAPRILHQSATSVTGSSSLLDRRVVRTALCVEPRGGILHVFSPPLDTVEQWLALVGAVEATTVALKTPVRLEGYPPPFHPELEKLSVTPDPGVIEVNLHPSRSWKALVENTTRLHQVARETRLGTDKFLIDGRHSGTGGGNHIVLGGATPGDSPFLRRPQLLTSLVAFFNNHPSLSYLFSGLFVGPTSQAPRLDEARSDSLYEFELAREHLRSSGNHPPPWLIDRSLRNLLVDVTGNTHRTEFCIDKLFSPDGANGRLGLVEMRAFEMPPDARMSLAQQLLVRALVARFYVEPYERRMVRWGSALHDRFALPCLLWQDLVDSLEEISTPGARLDENWYRPHFEFRFPLLGRLETAGLELEVRQAIEPWHVLGEEQSRGGTARYVDSSVERIEVLVNNVTETRHCLTVGRHVVPLVPTGRTGQYVGGIRYKAWKPPSSLHPTLEVNVPVKVDIYDRWNRRSIGAFTYYVAHPGGRNYDQPPTNGLEAESRRKARFYAEGHQSAPFELDVLAPSFEAPLTLDLRR